MSSPLRRVSVAVAVLLLVAPAAARAQTTRDFAATALNIVPSGQQGAFPVPAGADRQAQMYDALTGRTASPTSGSRSPAMRAIALRFGTSCTAGGAR